MPMLSTIHYFVGNLKAKSATLLSNVTVSNVKVKTKVNEVSVPSREDLVPLRDFNEKIISNATFKSVRVEVRRKV